MKNRTGAQLFVTDLTLPPAELRNLSGYHYGIPAISHLTRLSFSTPVTFFVGENGSGKSTLLEAIAGAFGLNPEGGSKHVRFSTRPTHSSLWQDLKLTRTRPPATDSYFLRAESFYNLASAIDQKENYAAYDPDAGGGRSLHQQSHGESFLALVLNRLKGNGFYLFDEPEAALSPTRQLSLLAAMHDLVRRGSQFIIATHSPILLGYPEATIYQFADREPVAVTYEETEHFQITKSFLDNPARMLRELMREEGSEE